MKYLFTTLILVFLGSIQLLGQTVVDFTDPATATYGTNARAIIDVNGTDVAVMWGGDANQDGKVRYSDGFIPPSTVIPSDAIAIFNELQGNPASELSEYSHYDVNMDGKVRYSDGFIPPSTVIPSDAIFIFNLLDGNPAGEISQQF